MSVLKCVLMCVYKIIDVEIHTYVVACVCDLQTLCFSLFHYFIDFTVLYASVYPFVVADCVAVGPGAVINVIIPHCVNLYGRPKKWHLLLNKSQIMMRYETLNHTRQNADYAASCSAFCSLIFNKYVIYRFKLFFP